MTTLKCAAEKGLKYMYKLSKKNIYHVFYNLNDNTNLSCSRLMWIFSDLENQERYRLTYFCKFGCCYLKNASILSSDHENVGVDSLFLCVPLIV